MGLIVGLIVGLMVGLCVVSAKRGQLLNQRWRLFSSAGVSIESHPRAVDVLTSAKPRPMRRSVWAADAFASTTHSLTRRWQHQGRLISQLSV